MATYEQLINAARQQDAAGNIDDARRLASMALKAKSDVPVEPAPAPVEKPVYDARTLDQGSLVGNIASAISRGGENLLKSVAQYGTLPIAKAFTGNETDKKIEALQQRLGEQRQTLKANKYTPTSNYLAAGLPDLVFPSVGVGGIAAKIGGKVGTKIADVATRSGLAGRVAGSAASGALQGQLLEGDAKKGAAVGAAFPVAGKILKTTVNNPITRYVGNRVKSGADAIAYSGKSEQEKARAVLRASLMDEAKATNVTPTELSNTILDNLKLDQGYGINNPLGVQTASLISVTKKVSQGATGKALLSKAQKDIRDKVGTQNIEQAQKIAGVKGDVPTSVDQVSQALRRILDKKKADLSAQARTEYAPFTTGEALRTPVQFNEQQRTPRVIEAENKAFTDPTNVEFLVNAGVPLEQIPDTLQNKEMLKKYFDNIDAAKAPLKTPNYDAPLDTTGMDTRFLPENDNIKISDVVRPDLIDGATGKLRNVAKPAGIRSVIKDLGGIQAGVPSNWSQLSEAEQNQIRKKYGNKIMLADTAELRDLESKMPGLINKNGMGADEMVVHLQERGFLPQDLGDGNGVQQMRDLIEKEMNGEFVYPQFGDVSKAKAYQDYLDELAAQEEARNILDNVGYDYSNGGKAFNEKIVKKQLDEFTPPPSPLQIERGTIADRIAQAKYLGQQAQKYTDKGDTSTATAYRMAQERIESVLPQEYQVAKKNYEQGLKGINELQGGSARYFLDRLDPAQTEQSVANFASTDVPAIQKVVGELQDSGENEALKNLQNAFLQSKFSKRAAPESATDSIFGKYADSANANRTESILTPQQVEYLRPYLETVDRSSALQRLDARSDTAEKMANPMAEQNANIQSAANLARGVGAAAGALTGQPLAALAFLSTMTQNRLEDAKVRDELANMLLGTPDAVLIKSIMAIQNPAKRWDAFQKYSGRFGDVLRKMAVTQSIGE